MAILRNSGGPAPYDDQLHLSVAKRWYGMWEKGASLAVWVNGYLNTHVPKGMQKGGEYPDPHAPGAWSWQKMLYCAARDYFQLRLDFASKQSALAATHSLKPILNGNPRRAWIRILPPHDWLNPEEERRAIIEMRPFDYNHSERDERLPGNHARFAEYFQTCVQVAMVFAYLCEDWENILDINAFDGYYVGDNNPDDTACYHQFAIAFLKDPLVQECPAEWLCQCNDFRKNMSAAPPEHATPTDSFERSRIGQRIRYLQEAREEKVSGHVTHAPSLPGDRRLPAYTGDGTDWYLPDYDDDTPRDPRGRRTGA